MNCPFCGQKRAASLRFGPSLHFECGTALCASHIKRHFQSKKCAEAEIENLNARIARLEEAGDDLRVCCESVVSPSDVVKYVKRWTEAKEAKP